MNGEVSLRLTATAVAAGLTLFAGLAALGWPGTPVDCSALPCWCEARAPGLWRQPVNTWSNLVPLLAALALAPRGPVRRFADVAFPLALAFQGLGSMFFHASLVEWAGAVDAASMLAVAGLLLAVNLVRGGVLHDRALPGACAGSAAAGVALGLCAPGAVAPVFGVVIAAVLSTEGWLHQRRPAAGASWFRAGLATFLIGGFFWVESAFEGLPLCDPGSALQGHAVWHATSAVAVCCFWLHVSPRPRSRPGSLLLPPSDARPGSARAGV